MVSQLFALRLGTGSRLANHTTGYTGGKLYGQISGRLSKSPMAAEPRKIAAAFIMMISIASMSGPCKDSGAG